MNTPRIFLTATLFVAGIFWFSAASVPGADKGRPMTDHATSKPIVLGYYPSWKSGLEPDRINYRQFTHLCHAFLMADTSGTLKTEGNLPSRELTSRAHAAGVKVLLSIGGADSGAYMAPITTNPLTRERFALDITAMALDHGYDGIDLDWEFPVTPEQKDALTALARRIRAIFNEKKLDALLTSAKSGAAWASRHVDAAALLEVMDFISVMTYDVHGPWSDHAGYNAPLRVSPEDRDKCTSNSLIGQMAHWTDAKEWPKNRLLVGVPCYGRGFVVEKWHEPFPSADKPAHPYLPFKDVAGLLADGWVRHWDDVAQVPWLSKPGVKELISYDDRQSARIKGAWAREHGFAGVFFWEISQDLIDGRHAIVGAAVEGFTGADGK
jgi:chitinase